MLSITLDLLRLAFSDFLFVSCIARQRLLFHPTSSLKSAWDVCLALFVVYSVLVVPVRAAGLAHRTV